MEETMPEQAEKIELELKYKKRVILNFYGNMIIPIILFVTNKT